MLIKHKMLGLHAQNLHVRPKWCCVVWINHFKSHCDFPDLTEVWGQRLADTSSVDSSLVGDLAMHVYVFVKSDDFKTESQMLIIHYSKLKWNTDEGFVCCFVFRLLILFWFWFWFLETRSLFVSLAILELTIYIRLAWNSKRSACVCLQVLEVKA